MKKRLGAAISLAIASVMGGADAALRVPPQETSVALADALVAALAA